MSVIDSRVPRIGGEQRMSGHNASDEQLVGDVGRVVLVHVDLFEHDVALRVDLVLAEGRALDHLGENLDGKRQMSVPEPRPVAVYSLDVKALLRAPTASNASAMNWRRHLLRALEEQVLEEVAGTGLGPCSSRLPVSTQHATDTERTEGMSSEMIRSPLGSVVRS